MKLFPILLAVALCVSSGCNKSPSGPSQPGPTGPTLVCPSNVSAESGSGGPVVVPYTVPAASTGYPPVSVSCAPGPDAPFPVGSTAVVCTAVDTVGTGACTFRVDVTRPAREPKYTRFVAFGDSQTEGYLRDPPEGEFFRRPLYVSPTENYPYRLQQMLRLRYGRDDIVVVNEGLGGETVVEAQDRILGTLATTQPQVLLVLHGYNDILKVPLSDARDAFRAIIRSAQVRGVEVALATLFQVANSREESRPGTQERISDLNTQLRSLAGSLDLPGVADLEQAFGSDQSLYGSDGLHPNPAGYLRVAETFRDHIVERFEQLPPPPPDPPAPVPASRRYSTQRSGH